MIDKINNIKKEIEATEIKIINKTLELNNHKEKLNNLNIELHKIKTNEHLEDLQPGDFLYFTNEYCTFKTMLIQDLKGRYDIMLLTNDLKSECECYEYATCLEYKCLFLETLIEELKNENEWEFVKKEKNTHE